MIFKLKTSSRTYPCVASYFHFNRLLSDRLGSDRNRYYSGTYLRTRTFLIAKDIPLVDRSPDKSNRSRHRAT